jgi:pimeloyl-ACP methyl ester carboxylesterase
VNTLRVVLLPGSVLPADLAYGALVSALGADVETIVKDLEVYREATPPPDYSLDTEVAGVLREADARGWDRFHLVGYSGGGAAALAVAASHPARVQSRSGESPVMRGVFPRLGAVSSAQFGAGQFELRREVDHWLSYSSWRRHQKPASLRPSGARSSHWYMPQRPSKPRAYAE